MTRKDEAESKISRLLKRVNENRRRYLSVPPRDRVVSVSVPIGVVVGFEILGGKHSERLRDDDKR